MPVSKQSNRKKSRQLIKSPGFTGWAIIFLSIFIVVFVVSMLMPEAGTEVVKNRPQIVRLQLMNGCGVKGAAEEMSSAFRESSKDVVFDIIDMGNAETFNFDRTLVIDRKGDPAQPGAYSGAALFIGEILKIEPQQLILERLSDNLLDIDATVIIGSDFRSKLIALLSKDK